MMLLSKYAGGVYKCSLNSSSTSVFMGCSASGDNSSSSSSASLSPSPCKPSSSLLVSSPEPDSADAKPGGSGCNVASYGREQQQQ